MDAWYRAYDRFTRLVRDPRHHYRFALRPGDVLLYDNHRVLHGRTEFDSAKGVRHLQGAYIDHDGPDTMYRLAVRRVAAESAGLSRD